MELCIKTIVANPETFSLACFNPCFNGTMYKNKYTPGEISGKDRVSILVLMELCIKTTCRKISGSWQKKFQSLF